MENALLQPLTSQVGMVSPASCVKVNSGGWSHAVGAQLTEGQGAQLRPASEAAEGACPPGRCSAMGCLGIEWTAQQSEVENEIRRARGSGQSTFTVPS